MLNLYCNFGGILGEGKGKEMYSIHSLIRTLLPDVLNNELCHFYEANMFYEDKVT